MRTHKPTVYGTLARRYHSRIASARVSATHKPLDLLGCSYKQWAAWLDLALDTERPSTRPRHVLRTCDHIDHIIPIKYYNLDDEEAERGGRPANELYWTRISSTWGWVSSLRSRRLQSQTSAISKFKFACLVCTLIIAIGVLISGQWGGN